MARDRIYGEDSAFSAWVRGNRLLPAAEIVATDTDLWIHRYKTHVDSVGSRNLQSLIMIEAKTRNAKPSDSQRDTLLKIHRTIASPRQPIYVKKQLIRNFGVAFLSMSGTSPFNSEQIEWGRFCDNDSIDWHSIDQTVLTELLRFDRHPDTLIKNTFRRHHKTRRLVTEEIQPIGFITEVMVIKRS
jgi:hypothetical protein